MRLKMSMTGRAPLDFWDTVLAVIVGAGALQAANAIMELLLR